MKFINTVVRTALIVTAMLSAAGTATAQTAFETITTSKTVRVGAAESPPWYHQDLATGKWTGIGPDVAELVFGSIGVQVQYVPTDWSTAAAGLQSGKFDVMGAYVATPERGLAVDFTLPFYREPNGILTLGDQKPEMATWAALDKAGFKYAGTRGTALQTTLEKLLPDAQAVWMNDSGSSYLELESGRVEGLITGRTDALNYIKTHGHGTFVIPEPQLTVEVNFGVRRTEGNQDLLNWMNLAINYFRQNGDMQVLLKKYFPQ